MAAARTSGALARLTLRCYYVPMARRDKQPTVLHLERQLVVVSKPAGMLSQGDDTGDQPVAKWAQKHIGNLIRKQSGGKKRVSVFVVPVHRLDRPVSGALVLARSSKAAARLSEQFRHGYVSKRYLAVVEGVPPFKRRRITLWLKKDRKRNRVLIHDSETPGTQEAVTRVKVLQTEGDLALVELTPLTGRPHQLRATMAYLDCPVVGDLRYGASSGKGRWIALHSFALSFEHPFEGTPLVISAPLPKEWSEEFPWILWANPAP